MASTIWLPMVKTGFRELIGSWKIMAICEPRTLRICFSDLSRSSSPSKMMLEKRPRSWSLMAGKMSAMRPGWPAAKRREAMKAGGICSSRRIE